MSSYARLAACTATVQEPRYRDITTIIRSRSTQQGPQYQVCVLQTIETEESAHCDLVVTTGSPLGMVLKEATHEGLAREFPAQALEISVLGAHRALLEIN